MLNNCRLSNWIDLLNGFLAEICHADMMRKVPCNSNAENTANRAWIL